MSPDDVRTSLLHDSGSRGERMTSSKFSMLQYLNLNQGMRVGRTVEEGKIGFVPGKFDTTYQYSNSVC